MLLNDKLYQLGGVLRRQVGQALQRIVGERQANLLCLGQQSLHAVGGRGGAPGSLHVGHWGLTSRCTGSVAAWDSATATPRDEATRHSAGDVLGGVAQIGVVFGDVL